MFRFSFFHLIFILFLSFGCAQKQYEIKDLKNLKQNAACFLEKNQANDDLLSEESQSQLQEEYDFFYFRPWIKSEAEYSEDEFLKLIDSYFKNLGYGANKKKYKDSWIVNLFINESLDNYPNLNKKAITVRNTNLRLLPTNEPMFGSFTKLGQGYPFDMLQNSSIGINVPIFVSHISSDMSWVFVESSFANGWLPIEDIAFVSDEFITKYMRFKSAVVISDDAKIYDENGNFLFNASIGCKFPLIGEIDDKYKILIVSLDQNMNAVEREIFVDKKSFSSDYLEINMQNAAAVADKLIGQTYGWGGLYGYRDCSAMVKDYFSVFGLWLPRNSGVQAKDKDNYIDLSKLTKKQKKQKIIEECIPFWTLIWMKGHIMLYIGNYKGEPIVFHNIWGLRVKKLFCRKYINYIGESVITTLEPGKEIFGIKTDILKKVQGMRIVSPWIKKIQK